MATEEPIFMNAAPPRFENNLFIGTAGWQYADWKGIVYPERADRQFKPLRFLSRWFDLVEINVTYYRPIAPHQCAAWLEQVVANPQFRFCAKAPLTLTHQRSRQPDTSIASAFRTSLAPLTEAGRLGTVLLQFPWSYKRTPANRHYLALLADALEGLPLCVELRHSSWDHPDVYAGLQERGLAWCAIDQPLLQDCLGPSERITASFGYVRLHGRNAAHWFNQESSRNDRYNYLYSKEELAPWIKRLLDMQRQVNTLYVVTNNHYRGQSVVNALEILHSLGIAREKPPETLLHLYPQLRQYHS